MAKDRYAPKALDEIMSGLSGRLSNYAQKTQGLSTQQQLLSEFLGDSLAKKCRVSNYDNGTLMIEAVSASIAMRLNYLKMDMLSHFRSKGMAELGQIKITANPRTTQQLSTKAGQSPKESKSTRTMSQQTADYLKAIAADAPPSLKAKLERLAMHANKK